eukprot:g4384.t1
MMRLRSALALLCIGCVACSSSIVVDDHVRVTALSEIALRIEPKGPNGFEDRSTFLAVGRDGFAGINIAQTGKSGSKTTLKTSAYTIDLVTSDPTDICAAPMQNTDLSGAQRISTCDAHARSCLPAGATQADCCNNCTANAECVAFIYQPSAKNCWLMGQVGTTRQANDRVVGTAGGGVAATVTAADGTPVWSTDDVNSVGAQLDWPAPANATSYAIKDFPRFFVPAWGPTPIPADAKVDPALVPTNGYDFRNNVDGDTYVFLFQGDGGKSLDAYFAARRAFAQLAGATPLLPDYAYGTWFTWWHQYAEDEAKGEVTRWKDDKLPIDIWALDMNWRQSPHGHNGDSADGFKDEEHHYDFPNTVLFPDFCGPGDQDCTPNASNGTGWFDWLQAQGLRTYFNDHPFPFSYGHPFNGTCAMQTSPEETAFRADGLTKWLERGLTFWWFDANWAFSVPPPNTQYGGSGDGPSWDGMDNRVWGSHLYYDTVRVYNENHPDRQHTLAPERPMALTKYADGNMHPGLVQHQHPAQHRYPVWWTGDGVNLQASVESMVDSGLYDFKPFVHSDCGGDYRPKAGGDLLRWTAHCTFGTILRFHGSDHRPWSYDNHTEDVIRSYLQMRYRMLPALIAGGAAATEAAFPIVARADLFWPEHAEAATNQQYLHLNDTLVAPIWDSTKNVTSRAVWVPPGTWTDAWDGSTVAGPAAVTATQPYERQPMWHRAGGLMVLASDPAALRVEEQDWSELTLDAHPHAAGDASVTRRQVRARGSSARTELTMTTGADGMLSLRVSAAGDGEARAWVLRVHLRPGQRAARALVDGADASVLHIAPHAGGQRFTPFGGKDAAPAPNAGHVAQIALPTSASARSVVVHIA